jgi:exodeoxyribonuclease III
MKIISFNVNGIRAIMKKGLAESIRQMNPDILCFQETKANDAQVAEALQSIEGYRLFCNSAERPGYSGTAVLAKEAPISVVKGIGTAEHDNEGRVITCEWPDFYLVNAYTPNSGQELVRLDYREKWDADFLHWMKSLEKKKPVIYCGDLNVAHQAMDLANPKSNYNKSAGYTQREIDGLTRFLESGFVDTYRTMHPDTVKYSWWSARFNSRAKNVGWRIDYVLVSEVLWPRVEEAFILNEVEGSDHCPVGIALR